MHLKRREIRKLQDGDWPPLPARISHYKTKGVGPADEMIRHYERSEKNQETNKKINNKKISNKKIKRKKIKMKKIKREKSKIKRKNQNEKNQQIQKNQR